MCIRDRFITYIVYEIMYTCVSVPFGSLSSVMTDDVNQRTDLSRFRSLGGTIFMKMCIRDSLWTAWTEWCGKIYHIENVDWYDETNCRKDLL